jgi:hypothetical protein
VTIDDFVGREAEARTLLTNVEKKRSSLVVGPSGVGKTAMLEFVAPVLQQMGTVIYTTRHAPFGTFLREVFSGLWENGCIAGQSKDLAADLKAWGRRCPNNQEKAKDLVSQIAQQDKIILVVDDASGITPTSSPWLERLTEVCTVVAAVDPKALSKHKRYWKRFDEVQLGTLPKKETAQLADALIAKYGITADEPEVYRRRVIELSDGNPFELNRLVKYHASETIVKTKELGGFSQAFVERDEKGVALAPILLVVGAAGIALRYIARAQGNLDLYVIGGIAVALMIVLGPFIRKSLTPRSN